MTREEKNIKIKETLASTKERRAGMSCKTYEVKLDRSHLSGEKLKHLNGLFSEAKWLKNHIIGSNDIFGIDDKIDTVLVRNQYKEFEQRKIERLSSQMKQSVIKKMQGDIINLSKKKKKGNKVGRLKFKSEVNSIPLKQVGSTFRVDEKQKGYVFLQGYRKHFKVLGLKQIPEKAEWACAELLRKGGGDFFIHITVYVPRKKRKDTNKIISMDFGIETNITMSTGENESPCFPESDRICKLQRELARKDRMGKPRQRNGVKIKQTKRTKSDSKNRFKVKIKLKKAYNKQTNQKQDVINKFVSKIVRENDVVVCQNENIHGWHSGLFGKQVQHSVMGGIMSALKSKASTHIPVDRFFPSTKKCPNCQKQNEIPLSQRTYHCSCGHEMKRDLHSTVNLMIEAVNNYIPAVRRNSKPLEMVTSDLKVRDLIEKFIPEIKVKLLSTKEEAPTL